MKGQTTFFVCLSFFGAKSPSFRPTSTQVDHTQRYTRPKTHITIKHPPFEDVFPIEHGDFPASHVSFQGCTHRN